MAYYRECRLCRCTLDPGEGSICDDCMKEERQSEKRQVVLIRAKGQLMLAEMRK